MLKKRLPYKASASFVLIQELYRFLFVCVDVGAVVRAVLSMFCVGVVCAFGCKTPESSPPLTPARVSWVDLVKAPASTHQLLGGTTRCIKSEPYSASQSKVRRKLLMGAQCFYPKVETFNATSSQPYYIHAAYFEANRPVLVVLRFREPARLSPRVLDGVLPSLPSAPERFAAAFPAYPRSGLVWRSVPITADYHGLYRVEAIASRSDATIVNSVRLYLNRRSKSARVFADDDALGYGVNQHRVLPSSTFWLPALPNPTATLFLSHESLSMLGRTRRLEQHEFLMSRTALEAALGHQTPIIVGDIKRRLDAKMNVSKRTRQLLQQPLNTTFVLEFTRGEPVGHVIRLMRQIKGVYSMLNFFLKVRRAPALVLGSPGRIPLHPSVKHSKRKLFIDMTFDGVTISYQEQRNGVMQTTTVPSMCKRATVCATQPAKVLREQARIMRRLDAQIKTLSQPDALRANALYERFATSFQFSKVHSALLALNKNKSIRFWQMIAVLRVSHDMPLAAVVRMLDAIRYVEPADAATSLVDLVGWEVK